MPDNRKHRGPHPSDGKLFAEEVHPDLIEAVNDLSWLLGRGYGETAAVKMVGDRFRLKARQRKAVLRATCPADKLEGRLKKELSTSQINGAPVQIDGFNLLITIESALSGGKIFESQDGCYRDMASVHGTYKKVMETEEAILLIGEVLSKLDTGPVKWLFDSPISNSGRLKVIFYDLSNAYNWGWDIELVRDPDGILMETNDVVVTSDSIILNNTQRWLNLGRYIIDNYIPDAQIVRLA